jgi:hypothetical protein
MVETCRNAQYHYDYTKTADVDGKQANEFQATNVPIELPKSLPGRRVLKTGRIPILKSRRLSRSSK